MTAAKPMKGVEFKYMRRQVRKPRFERISRRRRADHGE